MTSLLVQWHLSASMSLDLTFLILVKSILLRPHALYRLIVWYVYTYSRDDDLLRLQCLPMHFAPLHLLSVVHGVPSDQLLVPEEGIHWEASRGQSQHQVEPEDRLLQQRVGGGVVGRLFLAALVEHHHDSR